ncbi:MAG: Ohr subfamily peroxiredoxin [Micavibrio aeruginosavorus]|uniref:Ohr subfamily peroxiredoxin n=1 Tax=Micavibrio aeruginosavorus TaxID=349221 RepID=A0A2W4ZJV4_9BACT|nr:MAG: Ohr subfamily peroxiredoxin [Micavibrio aeruginosavorus]PZP56357.1 MAG: Ohr subfamily peroxiredoxin [Micavibrio aeruginosavorus]
MSLYTTKVIAIGGRQGRVQSEDGILSLDLSMPKELGGTGAHTNPEQLFAAGYAACFGNAVIHITRNAQHKVTDDAITVTATVSMEKNADGGFGLAVTLDVNIASVSLEEAEKIVEQAHKVCPYSNAVKGNVPVVLKTSVSG